MGEKAGLFHIQGLQGIWNKTQEEGRSFRESLKSRRPEREDQAATIHGRDVWRDERSEVVNCDHCE